MGDEIAHPMVKPDCDLRMARTITRRTAAGTSPPQFTPFSQSVKQPSSQDQIEGNQPGCRAIQDGTGPTYFTEGINRFITAA